MTRFIKIMHPTGLTEWIHIDQIFSFYPLENPTPTQQTILNLVNGNKVTISQTVDEVLKQLKDLR
ncbi:MULTISPECIES: hypothetical protein [Olivibacter]|uniref:NAD-dependent epimerase/dehydratase n=3 Tax=Sphingobacteriaceae TaxID=84566 RepID=F4C7L2_SPHS2|nr:MULTISPECIES: hypothetical protein [Olivibacter]MDM8173366.1 hypothetical protein [Olivibacter sp. 47]MDX3915199.1 hypothetical protein [Pseudosphingobacterium sp.]QEL03139.1 hypothetical protein FKG96_20685 [Olivibacter sp. LS-1]